MHFTSVGFLAILLFISCNAFSFVTGRTLKLSRSIGRKDVSFTLGSAQPVDLDGDSVKKVPTNVIAQEVTVRKGPMDWYNHMLTKHQWPTKMISSGVVGGLGDILIQLFSCYKKGSAWSVDLRRLLVFSSVATFYIAPVIHVWFNWLEKVRIPKSLGDGKVKKSLYMIALDQTVGATVITAGFFYAFELANRLVPPYTGATLLQAIHAGTAMNRRSLWHTLVVNWYCWPIINFLNFHYVPIQYR